MCHLLLLMTKGTGGGGANLMEPTKDHKGFVTGLHQREHSCCLLVLAKAPASRFLPELFSLIIEKAKEIQKNIHCCFIDYAQVFDYVDHGKLWKALKEMGIPDHVTCLLRNLYAGQEASQNTV